jgi:hypothetical protein
MAMGRLSSTIKMECAILNEVFEKYIYKLKHLK